MKQKETDKTAKWIDWWRRRYGRKGALCAKANVKKSHIKYQLYDNIVYRLIFIQKANAISHHIFKTISARTTLQYVL